MTTLYNNAASTPGAHVLAIGVGQYPHLIGGKGPRAKKPLGLAQLTSPLVSVKAFLDWCLAPLVNPAEVGYCNPACPLASVEGLASGEAVVSMTTPAGAVELAPATLGNIEDAFDGWLERVAGNDANIGLFYYCGHGIMAADHYLLAEDFGRSNQRPWGKAFDVSNTLRAVEREVKGALYFFIDACKEISREQALTLGANPSALKAVDLAKPVVRSSSSLIEATGEGRLAFALEGRVARFTEALLTALSGYCGVKSAGRPTWDVDGETLAAAVRKLLENGNKTASRRQVSSQVISGASVPLLTVGTPPRVKVEIDLTPEQKRATAQMYLLSARGNRYEHDGSNGVFQTEVPRGFYSVGALAKGGEFAAIQHDDQDLGPPLYDFIMQVAG